jgi:hypothetical protein
MTKDNYTVLSLGWGVQSFTLAAMVALGELPMVDAAIFADTLHESQMTYDFKNKWTDFLVQRGVNVVTVSNQSNNVITNRPGGKIFIPAFTYNIKTNSNGQLRRQCTGLWKIAPLRRYIQANREGKQVEQWLGISTDEYQRMRNSDVLYITNKYPLIDLRMSRIDCVTWLGKYDIEIPPKSACTFCPYHDNKGWQKIKSNPIDYDEAIRIDNAIRKVRPPHDLFVHYKRIPLEDVDLRTPQEMGQRSLWDDECSGICGV